MDTALELVRKGTSNDVQLWLQLWIEVVDEVRNAVDAYFAVAVKLNATDRLEGGFEEEEALAVVSALDNTGIDLIDISGGTYFPSARSASDRVTTGPYFLDLAKRARQRTDQKALSRPGTR